MTCNICKLDKTDDNFYIRKDTKKLTGNCKSCTRELTKQWAIENPEKAKIRDQNKYIRYGKRPIEILPTKLECGKCHIIKSVDAFTRQKNCSRGFASGCKECWKKQNGGPKNRLRSSYWVMRNDDKLNGRYSELEFITWESYSELRQKPCYSCQYPIVTGLDRIDNVKGHNKDNVLPCCYECNVARSDFWTVQEMIDFIGPAIRLVRENRQKHT